MRPHYRAVPMAVKIQQSFAPLWSMLDELADQGTTDTIAGEPVIRVFGDGQYYQTRTAIVGVLELFSEWARRTHRAVQTDAILRLAERLHAGMPLTEDDVRLARRQLARLQRQAVWMKQAEAEALVSWLRERDAREAQ